MLLIFGCLLIALAGVFLGIVLAWWAHDPTPASAGDVYNAFNHK